MSEYPKPQLEETEIKILNFLAQRPHTITIAEIAYTIKKSRDETVYYVNRLREKGLIYLDTNLTDLRTTGDVMGFGLTDDGRDVL